MSVKKKREMKARGREKERHAEIKTRRKGGRREEERRGASNADIRHTTSNAPAASWRSETRPGDCSIADEEKSNANYLHRTKG